MSLEFRCELCNARPGEPCINMLHPGRPLPGRVEHYARALHPNDTARRRKAANA